MLINTPPKSGDIVTIKLVSGDEMIARFESEDEKHLTISKPVVLGQGPEGVNFFPWAFTGNTDSVKIYVHTVAAVLRTEDRIAKDYQQSTTDIAM